MAYRDMEFLAAEMRCLSIAFAATMNLKYYVREMGDIAHVISIYEPDSFSLALPNHSSEDNLKFLEQNTQALN